MGRVYESIDERLAAFIDRQPMFFVATAPSGTGGHVNCSPKSNDGDLVVLAGREVAYRDLTGSGVETIAHLRDNGRIVIMLCAFEGPPRIVRLHGRGEAVVASDPRFRALADRFPGHGGTRAFVRVDVDRISDSCGYGVPIMSFVGHRENLDHWAETKGAQGLAEYRAEKNARSLDGLPGLPDPGDAPEAQLRRGARSPR
jgi:Pyridoxamine 5'-phosphate oxidase